MSVVDELAQRERLIRLGATVPENKRARAYTQHRPVRQDDTYEVKPRRKANAAQQPKPATPARVADPDRRPHRHAALAARPLSRQGMSSELKMILDPTIPNEVWAR